MRTRNKKIKYTAAAIALLVLVALYFLLLKALPHYAARIPMLGVYLVLEYLVFNFIRDAKPGLSEKFKDILVVLWWLPVLLMTGFLILASFIPLQQWPGYLQVYLPGVAMMALLAKTVLFAFLIPPLMMEVIRLVFHQRLRPASGYASFQRILKRIAILTGLFIFLIMLAGSVFWVSEFRTKEITISVKNLPYALEGYRIVQISDVHLGSWVSERPVRKAVDIINNLHPDLVLFTGDMVNFSARETIGFEDVMGNIKSKSGVYAVMGNHDYGDYVKWPDDEAKKNDIKLLESFYKKINWQLLKNENVIIQQDTARILLAGVENWSATARFHRYGDMSKTMLDAQPSHISILMSHDPTHWEAEVIRKYSRFDLTLSGHTHGMQMGIMAFGIKWSPSQYLYDHWGGMYEQVVNGRMMRHYVNLGFGHIAYPGRIGILPEITVFTLKRE